MLEMASAYIKTIVSFLLISVFVEIISPEGYKKYLKLLMGLMLTATVLRPLIYMSGVSSDTISGVVEKWAYEIWETPNTNVASSEDSLSRYIFEEQLSKSICLDAEAERAEVIIDEGNEDYGEILQIRLYRSEKGDDDKKKAAYIAGRYGVDVKNIEFIYQ